jgi:hypothetical protein
MRLRDRRYRSIGESWTNGPASRQDFIGSGALELLVSCLDDRTTKILTPLFGGVSATVKVADLVRAG